jgi:FOG: Transposase and inactivated derivatives
MSKGTFFTGQPIFNQVLSHIPRGMISNISSNYNSDRYCKRFTTFDHLVTMLYSTFNQCTSLREVTTGLLAWETRIHHLGMRYHPRRSTISDANNRRNEKVFEGIYLGLLKRYGNFLSDSSMKGKKKKLYIFDSTTISLFQEVLKGSGLTSMDGRRKGGIKVHTLIRSDQDIPCMIRFSAGAANDAQFLKEVALPQGSVIVFDKGYPDYNSYNRFTDQRISWVTRLRCKTVFKVIRNCTVNEVQYNQGVISDQEIVLGHSHQKTAIKVQARLITYRDATTKKVFQFITNNKRLSPITIANYYKRRWQIELLFKRIKQNYPLKYFLGDSENAIKIQIWCALIADLLLKVIKKGSGCKWSFSNLAGMVRLHLMTYTDLNSFARSAEKTLLNKIRSKINQLTAPSLFAT